MNDTNPLMAFLAAGISGSARLHERLGDGEALRAVDRCMKRIERVVGAFSGHLIEAAGDEMLASFDTVEACLHAALEMQERIADLPPVSGVKMAIRVGISWGEADDAGRPVGEHTRRETALLTGAAKAGQVLACARIRGHIPPALSANVVELEPGLLAEAGCDDAVLEIRPIESTAVRAGGAPLAADGAPPGCLRLVYRGETLLLNGAKPLLRMGRDTACDLIIHDRRASRQHAAIELRGHAAVLIDQSTNGTYVTQEGLPERFVRRGECVLRGKGVISFAASSASSEADLAEFEIV